MNDHLRRAGRARRQHDPFGFARVGERDAGGNDGGTAGDLQRQLARRRRRTLRAGDHRIRLRGRDHVRKLLRRQIGRAENEPARDAVELDQRQSGRELIRRCKENRAPRERGKRAAEARSLRKIAERNAGVGCPQEAAGRCGAQELTKRFRASLRHFHRP